MVGVGSLLPPCSSWGLNLGLQSFWRVPVLSHLAGPASGFLWPLQWVFGCQMQVLLGLLRLLDVNDKLLTVLSSYLNHLSIFSPLDCKLCEGNHQKDHSCYVQLCSQCLSWWVFEKHLFSE